MADLNGSTLGLVPDDQLTLQNILNIVRRYLDTLEGQALYDTLRTLQNMVVNPYYARAKGQGGKPAEGEEPVDDPDFENQAEKDFKATGDDEPDDDEDDDDTYAKDKDDGKGHDELDSGDEDVVEKGHAVDNTRAKTKAGDDTSDMVSMGTGGSGVKKPGRGRPRKKLPSDPLKELSEAERKEAKAAVVASVRRATKSATLISSRKSYSGLEMMSAAAAQLHRMSVPEQQIGHALTALAMILRTSSYLHLQQFLMGYQVDTALGAPLNAAGTLMPHIDSTNVDEVRDFAIALMQLGAANRRVLVDELFQMDAMIDAWTTLQDLERRFLEDGAAAARVRARADRIRPTIRGTDKFTTFKADAITLAIADTMGEQRSLEEYDKGQRHIWKELNVGGCLAVMVQYVDYGIFTLLRGAGWRTTFTHLNPIHLRYALDGALAVDPNFRQRFALLNTHVYDQIRTGKMLTARLGLIDTDRATITKDKTLLIDQLLSHTTRRPNHQKNIRNEAYKAGEAAEEAFLVLPKTAGESVDTTMVDAAHEQIDDEGDRLFQNEQDRFTEH